MDKELADGDNGGVRGIGRLVRRMGTGMTDDTECHSASWTASCVKALWVKGLG